jgi:hypothetical protein
MTVVSVLRMASVPPICAERQAGRLIGARICWH